MIKTVFKRINVLFMIVFFILESLKETNKKRSSLIRIFKYSKPYLHFIIGGTVLLVIGSISIF